jgi:hypothetical protein
LSRSETPVPRRYDVDTAAIVMSSPSQRMHDPSHSVFGRLILWRTWAIQERSTAADEHKAGVLLLLRFGLAVLFDEVVRREFRCIHDALEVHIYDFEVWLFGPGSFVGEDFVLTDHSRVGDNVMNLTGGREGPCCFKEMDLILPGSGIAFDEPHSDENVSKFLS